MLSLRVSGAVGLVSRNALGSRMTTHVCVVYGRVQLKCDGTPSRMGREVKWKLANGVGSQYPSHYLGTWCIQHYYR